MSDLCSTVAGMVTLKGTMSTEGETLQVSADLTAARYVLSAVLLVIMQPNSEVPKGLMNYPVYQS
jgi:hypothetical protein